MRSGETPRRSRAALGSEVLLVGRAAGVAARDRPLNDPLADGSGARAAGFEQATLAWAGVNPTVRDKLGTLQDRRAAIDTRESAGSGQRRMQRQWPPRWPH